MPLPTFPSLTTSGRPLSAWFPPPDDYGVDPDAINPEDLPDGWTPQGAALLGGSVTRSPVDQFTYNLGLRDLRNKANAQIQGDNILSELNGQDLSTPAGQSAYARILGNNPYGSGIPAVRSYLDEWNRARKLSQMAKNAPLSEGVTNFLSKALQTNWSDPAAIAALKSEVKPEYLSDPRAVSTIERIMEHNQRLAQMGKVKPLSVNEEKMLVDRAEKAEAEEPSLELKQSWLRAHGIDPEKATSQQWDQSYAGTLNQTPQRKSMKTLLQSLQRSSRDISPILLSQFGLGEEDDAHATPTVPAPASSGPKVSGVSASSILSQPVQPGFAGVQQRINQREAKKVIDQETQKADTAKINAEDSAMWEKAKQELLPHFHPEYSRWSPSEYDMLTNALGKDPKEEAFTDSHGKRHSWRDVVSSLMSDERMNDIRKGKVRLNDGNITSIQAKN